MTTADRLSSAMGNHPNRGRGPRKAGSNPTPTAIAAARERAGLTQADAALRIHASTRAWEEYESGRRRMHPGLYELFLIKTGQPTGA